MGVRKKHHYVPIFYLKRFSTNNEGKVLGLYNYKNELFIANAPLKHQACETFLYGRDDEIEAELGKLESNVAKMFYYWTEEKILIPPPDNTNGFTILKRFILYQLYRTPKAGNHLNNALDGAFQKLIKIYEPAKSKNFEGLNLVHQDPVLLALLNSADKEYLLNFLSCKFIVNLSLLPFISSDAPVVMYNQFMEQKELYIGATSLAVKGLQIFYPIHPRLMICLYDPKIYSCGDNSSCISTDLVEDVHQLNAMQYINSNSQLFFNDYVTKDYIHNIINFYCEYKKKPKPVNEIIKAGKKDYLFLSFEDAHIDLKLSFFNIINSKNTENKVAPLRHPLLRFKHE
jgi:hypothetical protein